LVDLQVEFLLSGQSIYSVVPHTCPQTEDETGQYRAYRRYFTLSSRVLAMNGFIQIFDELKKLVTGF
jgi:hypothetical protein